MVARAARSKGGFVELNLSYQGRLPASQLSILLFALDKLFAVSAAHVAFQGTAVRDETTLQAYLEIETLSAGSLRARLKPVLHFVTLAVVGGVLGNMADRALLHFANSLEAGNQAAETQRTQAKDARPLDAAVADVLKAASLMSNVSIKVEIVLENGQRRTIVLSTETPAVAPSTRRKARKPKVPVNDPAGVPTSYGLPPPSRSRG